MGAGLLTFVRSDLEAVVEVNRGQRALSLADAGVQAARRQLRSDAEPGHYDADAGGNVAWAHVAPGEETAGKTLTLERGSVRGGVPEPLPSTSTARGWSEEDTPELQSRPHPVCRPL